MEHYSNTSSPSCACCGETFIEFLSIDHINGGGRSHRKEIRDGVGSYSSMYLWLIDNDFPEGFQVLCMNCNTSIGFYGYCPHQKNRQDADRNSTKQTIMEEK